MPTVGTRRSTRVFVPKQHTRSPGARVLRSGKRFAISHESENDWIKIFNKTEPDLKFLWEGDVVEKEKDEKNLFGAVYSRKRKRKSSFKKNANKIGRYGVVFERRNSKNVRGLDEKMELLVSKKFLGKLGVLESEIWSGVESCEVFLAVAVESSVGFSLERFERFVFIVMSWMMRGRVKLCGFVKFVCFGLMGSVFSKNGIHFLPLKHHTSRIRAGSYVPGCGFCEIYGSASYVPLLSVDYSALPNYFKCLHADIFLQSLYFPSILCNEHVAPVLENSLVLIPPGKHIERDDIMEINLLETLILKKVEGPTLKDSSAQILRSLAIVNGFKLRKHQRKRSSLKNSRSRNRNFSALTSRFGSFRSKREFSLGPLSVKPLDSCLSDLFNGKEDSDIASSPQTCPGLRKSGSMKSPVEKIKEMRLALAEVRQNIESTCCKANILISDTEKCWREDGARVMMELSSSQEWFISVKRDDMTRFMHKPQDLRPCVVNRFTHAYMWSSEDDWKLEFCEKWDWQVFKELHIECRERNSQDMSKVIPVPGVREVLDYEDEVMPSFIRPNIYINNINNEVGRALKSKSSYYDMDSADEEWLKALNSSLGDAQHCSSSYVSEENFERIIFTFEKDAYSCLDDASDKDKALDLCAEMGTRDMVSAIHDYWLKKRKQKRAPLVRVFQGLPMKRTPLIQKPLFRKKRTFKRQRSQAERLPAEWNPSESSKPDHLLQGDCSYDAAELEAIRKVEEAEAAASKATDIAIKLRVRAQLLMSNADLATYRAAMALRIAETIRFSSSSSSSESPILDSSILFD